jgi:hypothetical protein
MNRTFERLAGAIAKQLGRDFDSILAFVAERRCILVIMEQVNAYYVTLYMSWFNVSHLNSGCSITKLSAENGIEMMHGSCFTCLHSRCQQW